ncbi:MAG: rhomboid family intramembrane serine protease [Terracidiphilus sp.]
MPRLGATPFAFPDFTGATRRLVLWNLAAYFALLLAGVALHFSLDAAPYLIGFAPGAFLDGRYWQPFTYSFVHIGIGGTLLELLSLFFLAGFLENYHRPEWVTGIYFISVLGTAAASFVIYECSHALGYTMAGAPLMGCFGGIFGLLVAIGALYGDVQFMLFPLPIGIKARYLVVVYLLVIIAMLFSAQKGYAFAQLGGAVAGLLYVRVAPRRGISPRISELWYGARNRYYRWKRHRAARKFEVYMRAHGRNVRFDGQGRQLDDDDVNDRSRWN